MQTIARTLALSAILAVTAQADWALSGYPVQAADSSAANKHYGIRTFSNPASATKVKVDSGRVVFHADYASDSTEGNSANVGFVHELRPGEGPLDQSDLTAISFQFKCSAPITGDLEISIGSSAYSDTMLAVGAVFKYVLRGSTVSTGVSDWKTVELDIKDFYVDGANLDSRPRLESVLKKMTHLRIAPKSSYQDSGMQNGKPCAKCVKPTMSSLDLEIRDIVLKGIVKNPWPNPTGIGCEASTPYRLLGDFTGRKEYLESEKNYWGIWTDSGNASVASDLADKAKGSSRATVEILPGEAGVSGIAVLTAALDRRIGSILHEDAGWASLSFMVHGGNDGMIPPQYEMSGIQFHIKAESFSPSVDSIQFKLFRYDLPDSAAYSASFGVTELQGEEGKVVCVRPEDLRQRSILAVKNREVLVPEKVRFLTWAVKISNRDPGFADTAYARFWITDVKWFEGTSGVLYGPSKYAALSARASNGILHLSGTQGFQRFEVVSMQGRKVASFAPAPTIALDLPRGTYHLVGVHNGVRVAKTFAVVR